MAQQQTASTFLSSSSTPSSLSAWGGGGGGAKVGSKLTARFPASSGAARATTTSTAVSTAPTSAATTSGGNALSNHDDNGCTGAKAAAIVLGILLLAGIATLLGLVYGDPKVLRDWIGCGTEAGGGGDATTAPGQLTAAKVPTLKEDAADIVNTETQLTGEETSQKQLETKLAQVNKELIAEKGKNANLQKALDDIQDLKAKDKQMIATLRNQVVALQREQNLLGSTQSWIGTAPGKGVCVGSGDCGNYQIVSAGTLQTVQPADKNTNPKQINIGPGQLLEITGWGEQASFPFSIMREVAADFLFFATFEGWSFNQSNFSTYGVAPGIYFVNDVDKPTSGGGAVVQMTNMDVLGGPPQVVAWGNQMSIRNNFPDVGVPQSGTSNPNIGSAVKQSDKFQPPTAAPNKFTIGIRRCGSQVYAIAKRGAYSPTGFKAQWGTGVDGGQFSWDGQLIANVTGSVQLGLGAFADPPVNGAPNAPYQITSYWSDVTLQTNNTC